MVNGKQIALSGELAQSGIKICHLADFPMIFKHYKNLKFLYLDASASLTFLTAYSKPAIPFTQSKVLQGIQFVNKDGVQTNYTRAQAAQNLNIPPERLNCRLNDWNAMASQVNKGSTSAFCKPGNRLIMADWAKRMSAGAFGTESGWSKKRRVGAATLALLCLGGALVTGGIQAARAARQRRY